MELLASGEMTIDKPSLVGGLVSASSAWVAYSLLEGHAVEPVLAFPAYDVTRLIDLGHAVWLGALGGAIGLTHLLLFKRMRLLLRPIRKRRPWAAAGLGALALVPVAVFVPRLLFSGEDEVGGLVADAAELGIGVLLALAVGKLLFSAWSLSTAYFGGPLFPMIYGGTAIGLAIHLLFPDVPEAVAVMAMIAGVVSAAAPAPFSITVFLGLLSSITLVPPIAIAAASAYVVRSLVVPTDLGEYRMIAAEERRLGD
jgi:H+/Cl- antiporter ClcA